MLTTKQIITKKSKKSRFRKVSEWLHLWLGLISGIIVFIVCLTGGIWTWRYETWYFTEQYQRVTAQDKPYLIPSAIGKKVQDYFDKKGLKDAVITGINYSKPGKSALIFYHPDTSTFAQLYVNPYTAEILKDKSEAAPAEKFFIFIRAGHRFLWLPQKIGSPIVGAACIIFVVTMITGLIWWFPLKWTKKTREKSFKVKWSAGWKRLNIDLHNVFGFYSLLFVMLLTITGIMFTFRWFEHGVFRTLTWRAAAEKPYDPPTSDTRTTGDTHSANIEDEIWARMHQKYGKRYGKISIDFPEKPNDSYQVMVQFGDGTLLYNNAVHYFDKISGKELLSKGERARPYSSLSLGEKIYRMDFDIHTGQILGLPTKILAFLACIIGASLPITGFIIWYNRKWGKKNKKVYRKSQVDGAE